MIKAIEESDIHKILCKQTKNASSVTSRAVLLLQIFFALVHKTLAENANKIKHDDGNEGICSVGS